MWQVENIASTLHTFRLTPPDKFATRSKNHPLVIDYLQNGRVNSLRDVITHKVYSQQLSVQAVPVWSRRLARRWPEYIPPARTAKHHKCSLMVSTSGINVNTCITHTSRQRRSQIQIRAPDLSSTYKLHFTLQTISQWQCQAIQMYSLLLLLLCVT